MTSNNSHESNLMHAAKVVCALSGWGKPCGNDGKEVYQTSYMAVQVLRAAIQEAENPQLKLESEPIGVVETVRRLAPAGIAPGRV